MQSDGAAYLRPQAFLCDIYVPSTRSATIKEGLATNGIPVSPLFKKCKGSKTGIKAPTAFTRPQAKNSLLEAVIRSHQALSM